MIEPVLLDKDFKPVAPLHPMEFSANIELIPVSSIQMTIPSDGAVPNVRDWIRAEVGDNMAIWRVASVSKTYGNGIEITAEHGIVALQDSLIPKKTPQAEDEDEDSASEPLTVTGSLRAVIEEMLSYQSKTMWRLGSCIDVGSVTIEYSGNEVLKTIVDLTTGYLLTFDQSQTPWTMNVSRIEGEASCEARISRNINGVTISTDSSELCTRAVNEELSGGYMDADTVSKYGVIAKQVESSETESIENVCRAYLEAHKEPAYSIDMDALVLSEITHEPMDAFVIGKMCRIVLPEIVLVKCITSISYKGLISTPEQVTMTLATPDAPNSFGMRRTSQKTVTGSVSSVSRSLGSYKTKNDNKVKKAYIAIDENAGNIAVNAEKIGINATDIKTNADKIEVNAQNFKLLVGDDIEKSFIKMDKSGIQISGGEISINGQAFFDAINAASLTFGSASGKKSLTVWGNITGMKIYAMDSIYVRGRDSAYFSFMPRTLNINGSQMTVLATSDMTVNIDTSVDTSDFVTHSEYDTHYHRYGGFTVPVVNGSVTIDNGNGGMRQTGGPR